MQSKVTEKMMVAFIFDSGKLNSYNYGEVVFEHILKGREMCKNSSKIVVSLGDILSFDHVKDIEPCLIKDKYCTIDYKDRIQFVDYPFCWILEDIELEIVLKVNKRLKHELDGYIGLTRVDNESTDTRKQFWKELIRSFVIFQDTITCFQDPIIEDVFCYSDLAKDMKYEVKYDLEVAYAPIEESKILQSSFVKKNSDIRIIDGDNDLDRNIEKLNMDLRRELQISGALMWKSICEINKIIFEDDILFGSREGYLVENSFLTLYYASQGIERIQKIIIELICKNEHIHVKKDLYELLKSHKHNALNKWIESKSKIKFNSKFVNFLSILQDFYAKIRYRRYSDNETVLEYNLLKQLGKNNNLDQFDCEIKSIFGKCLGELASSYYELVKDLCYSLKIYAYELDYNSTARIVFNIDSESKNLQKKFLQYKQSKKELLYCLIRRGKKLTRIKILKNIKPLHFDIAMINDYMEDLIMDSENGQEMFDEFDSLYDELCNEDKESWKKRQEIIDAVVANKSTIIDD